jgi:hypothetical protein
MREERSAKLLNVTMVLALVGGFFGLLAWQIVTDEPAVFSIYQALPQKQQAVLDHFANEVGLLAFGLTLSGPWVFGRRKRRAPRTALTPS